MVVYDLETFNTDKAFPYASCLCRLSRISGKYNRDLTQREYEKCRKDCFFFKGTDSFNEKLDYISQIKGDAKKVHIKIVKKKLYLIAHKGSGFDKYVVLNNLPH